MSAAQAAEPVWVYWYGRALRAQGNQEAATKYFQSIAGELNFYGQLATEELGQTLSIPQAPADLTQVELQLARENPGLQRAVYLFYLCWPPGAAPDRNNA